VGLERGALSAQRAGDLPDAILTPWNINVQQAFIYGSQGTFITPPTP
jgi:hypothetical protein